MTDTNVGDVAPTKRQFLDDVLHGLRLPKKALPCKYFYDARGAELFEQICELEEYYLTRTELAIMETHAGAMAECLGRDCILFEYGSGCGLKTQLLLDRLDTPAGFVPVDIAHDSLEQAVARLAKRFPNLPIKPVCADFTTDFQLPDFSQPHHRLVCYFPGSTIGNFFDEAAVNLLQQIAKQCGAGGGLLIGIDLKKERRIIEAAYNDRQGVTREFNLNLLARINRELEANFERDRFEHRAVYDEHNGRIEMFLISLRQQTVSISGCDIHFTEHERIKTEDSCKYDLQQFRRIADSAGFDVEQLWTDDRDLFSVQYLTVRS